ncbi:GDSL-type esterase/lipase family protein [Paenibacillus sp. 23TSA30-6]|uniref:GDSL-type esterase/lipase family protein n=1 Tax=Paenibacillus sp. 23TSA30-6 TaxID=2546104 RepID=UPI001787F3DA|nr:GDSL-type esterase/lipase family protein [Paenibacillus sp. 23TSA30-6]MBE0337403.1 esterase [Paenibacillus sp. 23TSA30-6]
MLHVISYKEQIVKEEFPVDTSFLSLYPAAAHEARPFILVLPGGGYEHLAQHEGEPIARWLNDLGIHAGVLHYQVGDFEVDSLLEDVEFALKWIRQTPKDWQVIPEQVGLIGFSAGGHLASIVATKGAEKPDLLLLGYPVITFHDAYTHIGSRTHFLGEQPTQDQLHAFSSDRQVTSQTPPTFIWTTANDATVPVENSLLLASALSREGISFELHVFEEGRHGLGLAEDNRECQQWLALAEKWLQKHSYVTEGQRITSRLFIAGDSTAAQKGATEKPMTGWGEHLQSYFDPSVQVNNRAVNGRSTKSFIAEGRLTHIEKDFRAGDYLFIQFGHNDEKKEDPTRYTDPDGDYRQNLIQCIESARERGGIPVLLTSVSRRRFTADGEPDPLAVGAYPAAMRRVAEETRTPLLDIFKASQQLYRAMGEERSKLLFMHLPGKAHPNYPAGVTDNTHFSDEGARQIAKLVAEAISKCTELHALKQLMRMEGTNQHSGERLIHHLVN